MPLLTQIPQPPEKLNEKSKVMVYSLLKSKRYIISSLKCGVVFGVKVSLFFNKMPPPPQFEPNKLKDAILCNYIKALQGMKKHSFHLLYVSLLSAFEITSPYERLSFKT